MPIVDDYQSIAANMKGAPVPPRIVPRDFAVGFQAFVVATSHDDIQAIRRLIRAGVLTD